MTYQFLEVHYPQLRPEGLVSTLPKMLSQVLKAGLVKKKKKDLCHLLIITQQKYCTLPAILLTISLLVISFEFLSGQVGEVVVVKGVPCGRGVARRRSSGCSFALILRCITKTELSRLDGARLRCKRSARRKNTNESTNKTKRIKAPLQLIFRFI